MNSCAIIIAIIVLLFIFMGNKNTFSSKKGKLAVVFFGLMRSLPLTIDNINENVFKILDKNNIDYEIFAHTYSLNKPIYNPRSDEINTKVDNDSYRLLDYENILIEEEEEFDRQINYDSYKRNGDPWDNDWISLKNVIRSLNSMKHAISLVDDTYDYVLILRPDMIYNKFNINDLSKIKENNILIPYYHPSGGYNDRIAMGNLNIMRIYANRFDDFLDYSEYNSPHAETYLKEIITRNNIDVEKISLIGKRVRSNGSIPKWDKELF